MWVVSRPSRPLIFFKSHLSQVSCNKKTSNSHNPKSQRTQSGLVSQLRNPEFRKSQSFGLLANLPILFPKGRYYIYYTGQVTNLPLSWSQILSLYSKPVHHINNLAQVVQNKNQQETCRNVRKRWRVVCQHFGNPVCAMHTCAHAFEAIIISAFMQMCLFIFTEQCFIIFNYIFEGYRNLFSF